MKKLILLFSGFVAFCINSNAQTISDFDGNIYDTVIIGSQIWMKQNLKTTHYNNGIPIPQVTDAGTWMSLSAGARCYYENDSATYHPVYGALYNWYVVNNNICPVGWHVPLEEEWLIAENVLGGSEVAGGKMKEAGTSHWEAPNTDATNSSRFTALPGGFRNANATYQFLTENGLWWTSTPVNENSAAALYFWNQFGEVKHNPANKNYGFSIRCISNNLYNGTAEIRSERDVKIYPNPAVHMISIESVSTDIQSIYIYDMAGICVYKTQPDSGNAQLDIRHLSPGVYMIHVHAASGISIKKLIKQ